MKGHWWHPGYQIGDLLELKYIFADSLTYYVNERQSFSATKRNLRSIMLLDEGEHWGFFMFHFKEGTIKRGYMIKNLWAWEEINSLYSEAQPKNR